MQRRRCDQVRGGEWEFPGGKIEPGELSRDALVRELHEELGIETLDARALMRLPFDYAHARVQLEVFVVDAFRGDARGCEGQLLRWLTRAEIESLDVLAAVPPILRRLDADEARDECDSRGNRDHRDDREDCARG